MNMERSQQQLSLWHFKQIFSKKAWKDFNEIHLGKHILHQACLNENHGLEIVECLLNHAYILDINVEATNDDGLTALQLAELNGDYDIVESFKKMELK